MASVITEFEKLIIVKWPCKHELFKLSEIEFIDFTRLTRNCSRSMAGFTRNKKRKS